MIEAESQKNIREICLRLLTRRDYSQLELLDRLAKKGFSHIESQIIIDDLAEQGWQSDLRFAESYARYRIKKGYGPIKISYELQQRGVESFDLDTVVFDLADDWDDLLKQVYERKYSDEKSLLSKEWLKRSRFLQQRGFSWELINRLFKVLNIKLVYS